MNSKRCFSPIMCELHTRCEIAHMPYTNGYFQPTTVGENCHNFRPLVISEPDDLVEKLARMAGAHE